MRRSRLWRRSATHFEAKKESNAVTGGRLSPQTHLQHAAQDDIPGMMTSMSHCQHHAQSLRAAQADQEEKRTSRRRRLVQRMKESCRHSRHPSNAFECINCLQPFQMQRRLLRCIKMMELWISIHKMCFRKSIHQMAIHGLHTSIAIRIPSQSAIKHTVKVDGRQCCVDSQRIANRSRTFGSDVVV